MPDDEIRWPMGMTDRDLADRPLVFDPRGFLVAIVTDEDEADRAVDALRSAGFPDCTLRVYTSHQETHMSAPTAPLSARVTGATSGIGRATALRLAADGFEVIVHGRDPERGAASVTEIEHAGGRARFVPADLADPDDVAWLAKEADDVAVLINNGGFSWFGPTADLDVATFDALFASNVRAAYLVVAAIAPRMAARGTGSIVNVASMAGIVGLAGSAAYGATKASLATLTRSWAAEFSPAGVRVNAIAPGPVYTGGASRDQIAQLGSTTLLDRAVEPAEIAELIAFLTSPTARYLTGATVPVDGGRTAV